MKKKTLAVPMIGFQHLLLDLGCGPLDLDFKKLPIGCVGFALLFEDLETAKEFAPEAAVQWGGFTMKTGLPPWENAKGSG